MGIRATMWVAAAVLASCAAPSAGDPVLSMTVSAPCRNGDGEQVRVVATDGFGKIGTGSVEISRTIGSVTTSETVQLDSYGVATLDFTCDGCIADLELEAIWRPSNTIPVSVKRTCVVENTIPMQCVVGTATSMATASNLNLFGTPIFFANGASLAPGRYRVTHSGGCMKYGTGQTWMTQAWADGSSAWWMIGATTSNRLFILPGVFGWAGLGTTMPRDVGDADFSACDAKNRASTPKVFMHTGGPLGIMLVDSRYDDNTAGENDRNPSWQLAHDDCQ